VVEPPDSDHAASMGPSYSYGDVRIDESAPVDGTSASAGDPPAEPPEYPAASPSAPVGDEPTSVPKGLPVLPKIPDWLEGLDPPDRR